MISVARSSRGSWFRRSTPRPVARWALTALAVLGGPLAVASSARADFGFITQWGSSGAGHGQFEAPVGAATDARGNVYVADSSLDSIQKFDPTGRYLASFGAPRGPDCTVTHDAPPPGALCVPHALAISGKHVYVVDTYGGRIQEFTTGGRFVRTWGSLYCGQGNRPPNPVFCFPVSDAVDDAGNVYVADAGAAIQVFKPNGAPLASWPGPMCSISCFNQGLADGPGNNLYVADSFWGLMAAMTDALSETPGGIQENGIWGGVGTAPAQFGHTLKEPGPWSVAVDSTGSVYVGDNVNDRIEVFGPLGQFEFAFGSSGQGPGQFANPKGVAVGSGGNVYVADSDNDRVEKFGQVSAPPSPAPPTGEPNPRAPRLTGLAHQYRAFRPGAAPPGHRRRGTVPRGTTLFFVLDQPAAVTMSFERRASARRDSHNRRLTVAGRTGLNHFRFHGRIRGRRLHSGRYRVSARAVDPQGQLSNVRHTTFTVKRRAP
jgi:DNA-binding beta-propeller fold protein YncE